MNIEIEPTLKIDPRNDAWSVMMGCRHNLVWCPWISQWRKWNGKFWENTDSYLIEKEIAANLKAGCLDEAIKATDPDRRLMLAKHAEAVVEPEAFANVLGILKIMLARKPEDFDRRKEFMATPRGMLHVDTAALSPAAEIYYASKITGTTWVDKWPCPQWKEFIKACGNPTLLERAAGLCLQWEHEPEEMFVLYGGPAKRVFVSVLIGVLRGYCDVLNKMFAVADDDFDPEHLSKAKLKSAQDGASIATRGGNRHEDEDLRIGNPTSPMCWRKPVLIEFSDMPYDPMSYMKFVTEEPGIFDWMVKSYQAIRRLKLEAAQPAWKSTPQESGYPLP